MSKPNVTIPLDFRELPLEQMQCNAREFADELQRRRSVRDFANRPVPAQIIADCIRAAASAPAGANQQPWRFVAVSDPETKKRIRAAAEAEEREFYEHRAPDAWLDAIAPIGTNAH